jgi:hypothetical protein
LVHLISMQLTARVSLRDGISSLKARIKSLYHLGVKLHTLLDHDGYLPAFVSITPAREHEIKRARALNLPKGSMVVEDLGYTDYAWYGRLTARKIFLVTRQKSNARYRVPGRRPVNPALGLVSDETIQLTGAQARECPKPLRRIVYQDPETDKVYVFLTNHCRLVAKTIADIYKERWQIKIFFRWIKQKLKIKAFIGNSENAVMSQIYAVLIVYLRNRSEAIIETSSCLPPKFNDAEIAGRSLRVRNREDLAIWSKEKPIIGGYETYAFVDYDD